MPSLFPTPPFERSWDVTGAVARLLLSDEQLQVPTLVPTWRRTVDEWMRGLATRSLVGLGLPSKVRRQLEADLGAIQAALADLRSQGWGQRETMPSVLWMRLFSTAAVRISKPAAAAYARWHARGLSRQAIWLCQYLPPNGNWRGPKKFKGAAKPSMGFFVDDLLWRPAPPETPLWPYDRQWRVVRRMPFLADMPTTEAKAPSVEQAKRRNGGRLFETLRHLLRQAKTDMPDAIRHGTGRMTTPLSLEKLAERMRERYPEIQNYAITSIKGALGPLVKAPKGGPTPKSGIKQR